MRHNHHELLRPTTQFLDAVLAPGEDGCACVSKAFSCWCRLVRPHRVDGVQVNIWKLRPQDSDRTTCVTWLIGILYGASVQRSRASRGSLEARRGDKPCQLASATILTPLSVSQSVASWAVCSVRRMGLAMIAISAGFSDGLSKRSRKLWRRASHCSTPRSDKGGS